MIRSISNPPWMGCYMYSITGLASTVKFAGTHLYTWVERGTVRETGLAQEHNTVSLARARTQAAQSGVERTNRPHKLPAIRPPCLPQLNMYDYTIKKSAA